MSIAPDVMFTMSPGPLRDHVPDRGLATVEHTLQVDREDALELLVGAVGDHLVVRDAGDVADDVDAPVLGRGAVHEGVDVGALVTSVRCDDAVPPSPAISFAVASAAASSMSPPTIVAPAAASVSAVALPMPLPTPVSTATLPVRSNISCALATWPPKNVGFRSPDGR